MTVTDAEFSAALGPGRRGTAGPPVGQGRGVPAAMPAQDRADPGPLGAPGVGLKPGHGNVEQPGRLGGADPPRPRPTGPPPRPGPGTPDAPNPRWPRPPRPTRPPGPHRPGTRPAAEPAPTGGLPGRSPTGPASRSRSVAVSRPGSEVSVTGSDRAGVPGGTRPRDQRRCRRVVLAGDPGAGPARTGEPPGHRRTRPLPPGRSSQPVASSSRVAVTVSTGSPVRAATGATSRARCSGGALRISGAISWTASTRATGLPACRAHRSSR